MKFFNLEVDRIFCINLPERTDRRAHMEAFFEKHGLQAEFVDGKKVSHRDEHHTAGMIGCFQSHAAIYRRAEEEGINSYVVLEDDVQLIDGGEYLIKKAIENMPPDAELLYFGFVQDGGMMSFHSKVNPYWVVPGAGWGAHAYAVLTPHANKCLVDGTKVMRMEIDRQLIHLVLPLYDIRHFMMLPPAIQQADLGTNVQTHRENVQRLR